MVQNKIDDQVSEEIRARYLSIQKRIEAACLAADRSINEITLVAATKKQPSPKITELLNLGLSEFGENYAQELVARTESIVDPKAHWHFIGHLQSNKIRSLLTVVTTIHTLSSRKHADRIESVCSELGKNKVSVFIEVNVSGEAQKSGIDFEGAAQLAEHIESHCPHIELLGLMAIPPQKMAESATISHVPPEYKKLATQAKAICKQGCLSLGMSKDLEAAIVAGATHIRIGTALLGQRPPPA